MKKLYKQFAFCGWHGDVQLAKQGCTDFSFLANHDKWSLENLTCSFGFLQIPIIFITKMTSMFQFLFIESTDMNTQEAKNGFNWTWVSILKYKWIFLALLLEVQKHIYSFSLSFSNLKTELLNLFWYACQIKLFHSNVVLSHYRYVYKNFIK